MQNNSKINMCWLIICSFLLVFPAAAMALQPQQSKFPVDCKTTITVDAYKGPGSNFKTIQEAVDCVKPYQNYTWTCIYVRKGIYSERVFFDYGKFFIYLRGEGMSNTIVTSNGTTPFDQTATLSTRTNDLIIEGITFINSYNWPPGKSSNPRKPAAAAKIEGDRQAFYYCGFYGVQDTLWDVGGRHYFKQCTIEGAVDFIFGNGQSIYEKCVISVVGNAIAPTPGYITAHAREKPDDVSAFVFKHNVITGTGQTYFGRPWRKYARVIFYQARVDSSNIIVPEGWSASQDEQSSVMFLEVKCFGKGYNTSGRPRWVTDKKMSDKELASFLSIKYIDKEGWIPSNMIDRDD